METDYPLVGFKVLRLHVTADSVVVTSPVLTTTWDGPQLTAPAESLRMREGIWAAHTADFAEQNFRSEPRIERKPDANGELRTTKVSCSVLCVVAGTRNSLILPDGWCSDDVKVIGLIDSGLTESLPIDGLHPSPLNRLAEAWNVSVFPRQSGEAVAQEFGAFADYLHDYFVPGIRTNFDALFSDDKSVLVGLAGLVPEIAEARPSVAQHFARHVMKRGGWHVPNQVCARLQDLADVNKELADEVVTWLFEAPLTEIGWPHGIALHYLIDHNFEAAQVVVRKLSQRASTILLLGMVEAIPALYRRNPKLTRDFALAAAECVDGAGVQRTLRRILSRIREASPSLADEMEARFPLIENWRTYGDFDDHKPVWPSLARCIETVMGVSGPREGPLL